ncbi:SulA-like leucine-rich domain-containing protein [uncultured Shewanella sp.]|uniref:cell division inhibitor SulA n=1 Tax=uncultured Shewanella sp. TaxID=173975 RepID=UPI002638FC5E|nr:SulA-like leucine-rich domain-containing protein [uncultured Shewanella sp.]
MKITKSKQRVVTLTSTPAHHPGLWHYQDTSSNTINAFNHSITILNTQSQGTEELLHVGHKLAQLSQEGRWIVLISPPNIAYKPLLEKAGVRMDRILLVHAKDEVESLWAMEKALTNGTCSAVITWTQSLNSRDNRRLQIIAKKACATGYILDKNTNITQTEQLAHYSGELPILKSELH